MLTLKKPAVRTRALLGGGEFIPASRRYAAIDLLRILAAAAVVAFHYLYLFQEYARAFPLQVQSVASHGYLGVELFFMISGYVISLSAIGRTRRQFAYARFIRLWPAFVICLLITIVAEGISGKAPGVRTVLANLTMLPRLFSAPYIDDVYWSLMFEIFFYTAIAVFVISRDDFVRRLRVFTVVWLAIAVFGQFIELPKIKVILVLDYAPFFAVGMSVFLVRNAANTIADHLLLTVSIILAVVFAVIQSKIIGGGSIMRVHPNEWICGFTIIASASALFASTVIQVGRRFSQVTFALGGISYPLYLLHDSFGSFLVNKAFAVTVFPFAILVAMGAVTTICYCVWRVEMPIRRYMSARPWGPRILPSDRLRG